MELRNSPIGLTTTPGNSVSYERRENLISLITLLGDIMITLLGLYSAPHLQVSALHSVNSSVKITYFSPFRHSYRFQTATSQTLRRPLHHLLTIAFIHLLQVSLHAVFIPKQKHHKVIQYALSYNLNISLIFPTSTKMDFFLNLVSVLSCSKLNLAL